jgi:hypothetical protein
MISRKISVRYEGPDEKPYRIYWSETNELASNRRYLSLEEAESVARALMEEWNLDHEVERPES